MCSGWDKVSALGLRVFWNVLLKAVVVIKSYFQSLCSSKMHDAMFVITLIMGYKFG